MRFGELSLTTQFLLAGSGLMLLAMAVAGVLVNSLVANDAIQSKATATALLVTGITAPLTQDLTSDNALSADAAAQLDRLFEDRALAERFPHLEIWTSDGWIAYSRSKDLIGKRFDLPVGVQHALDGAVTAHFADLNAEEHTIRGWDTRFLEIYSPLREIGTDRIIAVAEIHEVTPPLVAHLEELASTTWFITAVGTGLIMLGLFGIVSRASRTITRQSADLRRRIQEAEIMSAQNLELKQQAERASQRITEATENFARSIGADLHDGPTQLVGFSILKLEQIRRAATPEERQAEIDIVETMLVDAVNDIRTISRGLLMPEIEGLSLAEIADRAVKAHELRTGTRVDVAIRAVPTILGNAVALSVFRFVQEGLTNAYRHAGGRGQRVEGQISDGILRLTVRDAGADVFSTAGEKHRSGFGIEGLRHRIESIGGTLTLTSATTGSSIEMRLKLDGPALA